MSATKVVLLGTGSPRPCLDRSQPAQLIEIAGQSFVIDCGDGVTGQLVRAGCDVAAVQKIFLTHLHWDHILGYAGLVWGGWSAGRPTLEVWGPPGTKKMHELLFAGPYKYERDGVMVTATAVKHTITTYAYRFEHAGTRTVFSGDTAACDTLVQCAEGADLLVQDACAIHSQLYGDERSRKIRDALIGFHASPAQAGRMAQAAGVKRLVCTHLLAGADAEQVRQEAASKFNGETIVGYDLMELHV